MIYVNYRKPEWDEWTVWPCSDKEMADKVRFILWFFGYEIRG